MIRKLAFVFVLVALAGAGWFLLEGGPRRAAPPDRTPPEGLAGGVAFEPDLRPALESPAVRAPAPDPTVADPAPDPATAQGFPFALEVVDAITGGPVPGAEVRLVGGARHFNALAFDGMLERGEGRRADDAGIVRFDWAPDESLLVLALAGARSGGAFFEAGTLRARERVELQLDWDVEVLVVGTDGAPLEQVPLRFALARQGREESSRRTTDAAGRAVLAHAGLEHALRPFESLGVRVELPFPQVLERRIDPARPPGEPVVFTLPSTGEVVAEILGADRAPVPDGTEVQLELVWPGEPRELSAFSEVRRISMDTSTGQGRARFRRVPLGAEVALAIGAPGGGGTSDAYFPGPGRAGEVVERTIVLQLEHPLLEFRALDLGGDPLGGIALELELHESRSFLGTPRWSGRSEEDGRFTVELRGEFEPGDTRILVVRGRGGEIGARLELSQGFEPGLVPMGDLVLGPAPVLVSGRVEDSAGDPVFGARVTVKTPFNETQGRDGGRVTGWRASGLEATSGADGTFSIEGLRAAVRLQLLAEIAGSGSTPVEADSGARGVRLVLRRTGAIAGRVELDPGLAPGGLTVNVSPVDPEEQGASGRRRWEVSQGLDEDGTFSVSGLQPGRRAVAISTRGSRVLATVTDVFVISGETTRDPRLEPLDLRGLVHRFRVTAIPPEPVEELRGSLRAWAPGEPGEVVTLSLQDGVGELLVPWERVDASLAVPGYRTIELAALEHEQEVRLEPAIEVHLVLPANVELPEPPLRLKAALQVPGSGSVHWGADLFDEGREVAVFAPGTGRLEVVWLVEKRLPGGGAMATTLRIDPVQTVDVLAAVGQRFELEVGAETLREAIARTNL